MRKLGAAAIIGVVVFCGGRTAVAQEPVDRIVYDDCNYEYDWDGNGVLVCHIQVTPPDFSTFARVAEGTDPALSPDGSRVAFSGPAGADILLLDLTDGKVTSLTSDGASNAAAAWSADGSKIAFQSGRDGGTQVFVINADGTGLVRLTQGVLAAAHPAWSPDGTRIAFDCQVEADNWDICSMAADGTDVVRLTNGVQADFGPAWSPDGTRIAFIGGSGGYGQAMVMNADGSGAGLVGDGVIASDLAWSSDGSRIAAGAPVLGACDADGYCYGSVGVYGLDGAADGYGVRGAHPAWGRILARPDPKPQFKWLCRATDCLFEASPSWDLGATITAFSWDFGDGATAFGSEPSHTYAEPGPHVVTLTATDDAGASGAHTETVTSAPNVAPTPSFTTVCSALTCTFDGATSFDSDGWIQRWSWDFGDGTTGSSMGPTYGHTFAAAGTYTATLTVTDDHGATGSVSRPVRAGNTPPVAAFTATCSGFTCSFDASASADPDGTVALYHWDFGDGGTAEGPTASHAYRSGTYSATLTVTDNEGATGQVYHNVTAVNASPVASFTFACSGLSCTFDGSASSDSDGTIEHSGWLFGDGAVAPGLTASHTYAAAGQYHITFTVTDNGGMSGQKFQTITVNTPPVASFTASCTSVTCSFDASPSSDPDGSVAAYAWTFGDGTAGSGVSATHAYAHAGPFTVTLLVTDNLGGTGAKSQTVTAVNAAPVASFTASCTHVTCSLNASASSDPDGAVAGYAWTFGDGTTGAGLTATHAYAAAASFLVTLVVTDNLGATGSASRTVTAVNAPPVASLTSSCTNLSCSFNGSASSDSDGSIAAYAWTFGDGSAASGATASHAYAAAGTYAVVLTVTDDLGATATRSASVTVTALIHVGDLEGRASISGSTWSASVTVTVHSSSHALVGGATVKGSWTGGTTASCTTAATGQCTVLRSAIPGSTKTVTFTVSALSHPAMTYSPAANHDPDGDSDGTSIVVSRR